MIELLRVIVESLVDKPEEIEISIKEKEGLIILCLQVAKGDTGKVIGKHGRIANAIRNIIKAASSKENKKVVVDIL